MAEASPATSIGDLVTRVKKSVGNIAAHRDAMAKVAATARATALPAPPKEVKPK